eukprot:CAMPEP_0206146296 /NCGR_PEP_ID=MMETSP1473-20131121/29952_1 /ASSEMBLY_ACC=CAM_ASM_001109 /TAXON_ID=1461547 /ORGANISM="Stichococcus sp, Strain RCC1054" /LENGTH=31 /DNA_ID= /DNA_START= /DNA_END= /DNA_ORIENTATION=
MIQDTAPFWECDAILPQGILTQLKAEDVASA